MRLFPRTPVHQFRWLNLVILVIATLWYLATWWLPARPVAALILCGVMVGGLLLWISHWEGLHRPRWIPLVNLIILTVAMVGAVIFADGPSTQRTIAVLGAVLLGLMLRHDSRDIVTPEFRRVGVFIMTLTLWLAWISLLGAAIFFNLKWWWLAPLAMVTMMAVSSMIWTDGGVPLHRWRLFLFPIAVFALELYTIIWWLPTSILVGSIVATTISILVFNASRHLLLGHWEAGRGRRYLLIGSFIMIISLVTARWI